MGRRNSGGGHGGGRGYHNRNANSSGRGNNSSYSKKKKELSDYWYYTGNSNQATNFETTNDFILNHILSEFEQSQDIYEDLRLLKETDTDSWQPKLKMSVATDPDTKKREDRENEIIFNKAVDRWNKRSATFESNKSKAYGIIWGRCAEAMKVKIQTLSDYEKNIRHNPVNLLKAIKAQAMNYEERKYNMEIIINSLREWLNCKQKHDENLIEYTRRLKNNREQLESHLGSPFVIYKLVKGDPNYSATDASKNQVLIHKYDNKLNGYLHIRNADQNKYGSLLRRYRQDFSLKDTSLKKDIFPNNMMESTNALSEHPFDNAAQLRKERRNNNNNDDKKTNNNTDEEVPALGFAQFNIIFAQLEGKCYCCGKPGHRSPDCRHKDKTPKEEWFINPKEEATSPTASSESILITGVIDAKQERDVMTLDVPNAFVQTPVPQENRCLEFLIYNRLESLIYYSIPIVITMHVDNR